MIILGIDYGEKKIGLSISSGSLAQPLKVIRYDDISAAVGSIKSVIDSEEVEKIVVGVSEEESEIRAREFGKILAEKLGVMVDYFDETLSTQEANILSREAGIKRKKRQYMEDAYSATIMLQNYLDVLYSK